MLLPQRVIGHRTASRPGLTTVGLLLLVVGGCQMESSGNGGGNPPPPTSATVSVCNDGTPDCPAATSFSVSGLRDLVVSVAWDNVPSGHHVQTVALFLPGGEIPYQQADLAFLIPDGAVGSFSSTRVVPVAGTAIPQRQLTGAWSVQASLDGQPVATLPVEFTP